MLLCRADSLEGPKNLSTSCIRGFTLGTNIGKLLQEAGVSGGQEVTSRKPKVDDFRSFDIGQKDPFPEKKALSRLPEELRELLSENDAREFLRSLRIILEKNHGLQVTNHTILGLNQMVHELRNSQRGSKRKQFDRIIPIFLSIKKRLQKKPPKDLKAFLLREIPD